MISVIMCVFNGEKYLLEQLESLYHQSLQPDEVLIYDDCSTDRSRTIITDFIHIHGLVSWQLYVNQNNKGWRLNFYDALKECEGDIIFFCDQDDIWYPDKIAVMADTMENTPEILVLNGLFHIIDAQGKRITDIFISQCNDVYDYYITKSSLYDNLLGKWQFRLGSTMVIRKVIKEQLHNFTPGIFFAHDLWALHVGALLGGCYWMNFPAVQYRVHGYNATGRLIPETRKERDQRLKGVEEKYRYIQYLMDGMRVIAPSVLERNEVHNLARALRFLKIRCALNRNFNILLLFSVIRYMDIYVRYLGIKQYVADLLEWFNVRDFYWKIKQKVLQFHHV